MDWGTRRKPLGAFVAWGSLAVFAVLAILGIAGLVMGLQPQSAASAQAEATEVAAVAAPAPEPVEERLPEELSFADAQAAAATPADPELQVAMQRDDMIASTFEQLVEPVVVSAAAVPPGAVATTPAEASPAETAVASTAVDSSVELPLGKEEAAQISARPRVAVNRNAAAWAIESEVPDAGAGNGPALGYAAQPEDEAVRVGDSSINVRSGPSQSNKRLFALASGAEVDVDGKADGWVSITDERGREGWVDASLLENLELDEVPAAKEVPEAEPEQAENVRKVTGSGVTVRAGPGKSNKQLFNLASGTEVAVLDDSKGWLKIKDPKGRTGWAYKDYLK